MTAKHALQLTDTVSVHHTLQFQSPDNFVLGRLVDLFRTKRLEFGVSLDTLQLVLNEPQSVLSIAQP